MYSSYSSASSGGAAATIIIGIIGGIALGFATKSIANKKGYDGGFWWGFFLGFLGLLIVALRKDISYQPSAPSNQEYWQRVQGGSNPPMSQGNWQCSHCGTSNSRNLTYCISCRRNKNEARRDRGDENKWTCACGASNNRDNMDCWVCHQPKGAPAAALSDGSKQGNSAWNCVQCGHRNGALSAFCGQCGTAKAEAPAQNKCPSCNKENPSSNRYCDGCGRPLG